MSRNAIVPALLLLLAATAAAQQRSIFDVDDFVDPRQHDRPFFASRLVAGGVKNYVDDFRPLHQNARFVHVANSLYWSSFEAHYKHSEVRDEHAPPPVEVCNCDPPVYFPTPPQPDETPAPPRPAGRDTLQLGWYVGSEEKLRYRVSVTNQTINSDPTFPNTKTVARHLRGRERSLGFEGDTPRVPILGFGTIDFARTVRSGTTDNRAQSELTYTSHLPGFAYKRILLRGIVTVGGVTGRGAGGINVVNPIVEAFWHDQTTRANFHLAWNPASSRSGSGGWETHQQIALFVDRALYVKLWRR